MHLPLTTTAFIWTHEPHPYIFRITENFGPRWYGLAYVLGFIGGAWLLTRYARANPPRTLLSEEKVGYLMIALVLGVFIGGRLGYFILYTPDVLTSHPLEIFRVWNGGMASHGGFVGVVVALAVFAWLGKIPFLHVGDVVASVTSLGLMLGRVANFINGELWGNVTDGTWGVVFAKTEAGPWPRHPSQLYEAALEGALLFAYAQWRVWRTGVVREQRGRLAGEYLAIYAVLRVFCEQFREPDRLRDAAGNDLPSLLFGVMSRGTFYSLFLFVAGVALIVYAARKSKKMPAPAPGP